MMTYEERQRRIEELNTEITKLKKEQKDLVNTKRDVAKAIKNQRELSFLYPRCDREGNWSRSTAYGQDFSHIRYAAISSVDEPVSKGGNLVLQRKKVANLSPEEHELVCKCVDDIIEVVAKYKKQYLISIGREDIVDAFGLLSEIKN